ncbi:cell surface protein [Brachyspira pilosicoli]|uniref:cell surface protein n=1 Tax=Brachyspira pilosicoli TaxID=52584 RepID=UPI0024903CB4|nr:cell surface protein [Brachyspira pilosicoli]
MKKILISILIIMSISMQVFAYYKSDNMIDMLVHSNQVQIRTDRFGVLAGTRNWRFAAGLTGAENSAGIILNNLGDPSVQGTNKNNNNRWGVDKFVPSALVAFGYDSDLFGVAAGYEFTWKSPTYMVHTPVLHMTALNDSFRINIPISIGVGQKSYINGDSLKGTMVVSTAIEGRYYFAEDIPALSHLRFYFNYGNSTIKEINTPDINFTQQSIGGEFRMYFKIQTETVKIEPIFRMRFDTALATKYNNVSNSSRIYDSYFITAKGFSPSDPGGTGAVIGASGAQADLSQGNLQGGYIASMPSQYYAKNPYRIGVALPVGFTATSADENITFYFEPALSLTILNAKEIYTQGTENYPDVSARERRTNPFYTLGYVVYAELYIRPVKDLEWYTEIQTGGATVAGDLATPSSTKLVLNGKTGISYYF